jgi:hypothetical protein
MYFVFENKIDKPRKKMREEREVHNKYLKKKIFCFDIYR